MMLSPKLNPAFSGRESTLIEWAQVEDCSEDRPMRRKAKPCRVLSFPLSKLITVAFTILCLVLILGAANENGEGQVTIATKRSHELYVSLVNQSGRLVAGEDELCALFGTAKSGQLTQVDDVSVDFKQQVGRITERPREFRLSPDSMRRYCGKVNLDTQFYQPSRYYVTVHYIDSSKRKSTCTFFLTMK
jgi:hypothetical protein